MGKPTSYHHIHASGEAEIHPTGEQPGKGYAHNSKQTFYKVWLPQENRPHGQPHKNLQTAKKHAEDYIDMKAAGKVSNTGTSAGARLGWESRLRGIPTGKWSGLAAGSAAIRDSFLRKVPGFSGISKAKHLRGLTLDGEPVREFFDWQRVKEMGQNATHLIGGHKLHQAAQAYAQARGFTSQGGANSKLGGIDYEDAHGNRITTRKMPGTGDHWVSFSRRQAQ